MKSTQRFEEGMHREKFKEGRPACKPQGVLRCLRLQIPTRSRYSLAMSSAQHSLPKRHREGQGGIDQRSDLEIRLELPTNQIDYKTMNV